MKITILNGNPDDENHHFEDYLTNLTQMLESDQHQVTRLNLREMDIHYCIGCFGCWVKTPGECSSPDDSEKVCRAVINSDFMLWTSPLIMGFPSALLKKTMDRSIPLIHPYFAVDHGEAHHRARYDHYPLLGLLLEKEDTTSAEDIRTVSDIFSRTALNMKSRLAFSLLTDQPVEQVAHAITAGSASSVVFDPYPAPTTGIGIEPPARLTVFNGSPRGQKGNTPVMLEQFLKGYASTGDRSYEVLDLVHLKDGEHLQRAFAEAECVLLGFPLYTDGMPGIVKVFIESLEPFLDRAGNPPIAFMVHSGFPEATHSRHVERYLEILANRLHAPYLGTLVKGGSEGIRLMPENMTASLFNTLFQIGKSFGEKGQLDPALLRKLAKPERYPAYLGPIFKLLSMFPLLNSYWNMQLKQNGVYEKSFARPYVTAK